MVEYRPLVTCLTFRALLLAVDAALLASSFSSPEAAPAQDIHDSLEIGPVENGSLPD